MPKIISIPEPCHEDWNIMTPDDKGRHCALCSKTVVDFTEWQPQEIIFYLQENAALKVCGRFAADQLNEPIPTPEDFVIQLHRFPMPLLKKAAAIFLFAFSAVMVSCNDSRQGKAISTNISTVDTPPVQSRLTGDTIITEPILGEPALQKSVTDTPPKKCKQNPNDIKGDVAVITDSLPPTMGIMEVKAEPITAPVKEVPLMGKVAIRQKPVADTTPMMVGQVIAMPVKHKRKP